MTTDTILPHWKIIRGYFDHDTGVLFDDKKCDIYESIRNDREHDPIYCEYKRARASSNPAALLVFLGELAALPRAVSLYDDGLPSKDEIKEQVRLSSVISIYTPLRQMGTDKYQAKCPLHEDRLPSFSINDEKGLWYCHAGCGGGDVFAFLMRKEQMTFRQAMETAWRFAGR